MTLLCQLKQLVQQVRVLLIIFGIISILIGAFLTTTIILSFIGLPLLLLGILLLFFNTTIFRTKTFFRTASKTDKNKHFKDTIDIKAERIK